MGSRLNKLLLICISVICFLALLSSCAAQDNNILVDKQSLLNVENTETKVADNVFKSLDRLELVRKDEFYDKFPNFSYDFREIGSNGVESLIYRVKVLNNSYLINNVVGGYLIRSVSYDSENKIYHLINNITNTSIEYTEEEYLINVNKEDIFYPFTFNDASYYGITGENKFKEIGSSYVSDLECIVYDVLDVNDSVVRKLYVAKDYNIILRVENLVKRNTIFINNINFDNVTEKEIKEAQELPKEENKNKLLPIEGENVAATEIELH